MQPAAAMANETTLAARFASTASGTTSRATK
jgi:hypothetical protein